jgi:putative Holliday junction resolvase
VTVLAIDYGRVRLGLAVSDEDGILASPLPALPAARGAVEAVAKVVVERDVDRIVVGLPLHMDGTAGEMAEEVKAFATRVAARTGRPIEFVDERWTSAEAERAMLEGNLPRSRRRALRDGLAAVLILQAYLGARRAGEREEA